MSSCPPQEKPERAERGRFARGNPGGPGNPFNRETAELRTMLMKAVKAEMPALIEALLKKTKEGNVAALKLALSYGPGKANPSPNPDRVDVDEWKLVVDSMVGQETAKAVAVDAVPVAFATAVAEIHARVARLEPLFPTPEQILEISQLGNQIGDLAVEYEETRRDYLTSPRFRDNWDKTSRWNELCAAIKARREFLNRDRWAANDVRITSPDAESPSPNGGIGRGSPSPNGGNGDPGPTSSRDGPGAADRPTT